MGYLTIFTALALIILALVFLDLSTQVWPRRRKGYILLRATCILCLVIANGIAWIQVVKTMLGAIKQG